MVEYITVHGKKYPIRIGYYVMKKIKDETGMSFSEATKKAAEDQEIHEIILYYSLKMGAFAEKTDMDLDREDMPMILDLCFMEYMNAFTSDKFFPTDELKKAEERVEAKSKALGKGKTGKKKSAPKKTTKKQT